MGHVTVLTDVPSEDVKQVVEDFQSEGAEVTTELQPNGLWTVRAKFPNGPKSGGNK